MELFTMSWKAKKQNIFDVLFKKQLDWRQCKYTTMNLLILVGTRPLPGCMDNFTGQRWDNYQKKYIRNCKSCAIKKLHTLPKHGFYQKGNKATEPL